MKYVIYLRVSTNQQVDSGLGIQSQREICHRYIEKKDDNEILEFVDEGFSGSLTLAKRPALMNAIACLEKGDSLVIAKRDRIGRDVIVNAMIDSAIKRKKANLISASGDVSDNDDAGSVLMKRMVDAFSEYERLIIGARTKAALQVKISRYERSGRIPYGYQLCTDGIHIEPNQHEQNILHEMHMMRNNKMSTRKIANALNEKSQINRNGNPWNHASLHRVINNGRYKPELFQLASS